MIQCVLLLFLFIPTCSVSRISCASFDGKSCNSEYSAVGNYFLGDILEEYVLSIDCLACCEEMCQNNECCLGYVYQSNAYGNHLCQTIHDVSRIVLESDSSKNAYRKNTVATLAPSSCKSAPPSSQPTEPYANSSSNPSVSPTKLPTNKPTLDPSLSPTKLPTLQPTPAPSQPSSNATSSSSTPIHQGVCTKNEDSVMNFIFGAGVASTVWLCIGAVLYAVHARQCEFCGGHNRKTSSMMSMRQMSNKSNTIQVSKLSRDSPEAGREKVLSFDTMYTSTLRNVTTDTMHSDSSSLKTRQPFSSHNHYDILRDSSSKRVDSLQASDSQVSIDVAQWVSDTNYMVAELETPTEQKAFTIAVENFETKKIDASKISYKQKVGSGFFGDVYRAEYFGAEVAVKQTKEITKTAVEVLLQEGKIWYGIKKHPNICRLIGYIHDEENLGLVMDFVENGSVLDCLERGQQFSSNQKYDIIRQASAGLWHLHADNFVHRDLALRNVLIDLEEFSVKITDFGMSRLMLNVNYANKTTNRMLPIAWSAPEAILKSRYSTHSDVWSFGVLIWELFSEKAPFQGVNQMQLMLEITRGEQTLKCSKHWNAEIRKLLKRCWSIDASDRPHAEEIFDLFHTLTEKKRSILSPRGAIE